MADETNKQQNINSQQATAQPLPPTSQPSAPQSGQTQSVPPARTTPSQPNSQPIAPQSGQVPQPAAQVGAAPTTKPIQQAPQEGQKLRTPYTPQFELKIIKEIPVLPDLRQMQTIDITYPVIENYVSIHIYWNNESSELLYDVVEPQLNEKELKNLELIEDGITELINISFVNIKDTKTVIEFLEKNLKILISEFSIKVPPETFLKYMYYIYRDFVGLGNIEGLMQDYFIEDIECNGINTPIYIVHRKYRNLKTNVTYKAIPVLTQFVEKLAQRTGQYVSYANPLLDGVLPESGARVNATYTQDISSKGPTFTIRKFTKEPWTPVKLMDFRSVSPEVLAYLWLLVENQSSIMVIGGTGSGKTSFLNAVAFFIPPAARIVSIEDSVTGDSKLTIKKDGKVKTLPIKEFVYNKIDAEVMTINEHGKIIWVKPSKYIKHKVIKDIYEITTSTGRRVKVTRDHSLFTLGEDNKLRDTTPLELKEKKSFIAVPRVLPIEGQFIKEINLMEHLNHFKEDFLIGLPLKKIFDKYSYHDLKVTKSRYQWWKEHNLIKIEEFVKLNFNFDNEELKELKIKSKNKSSIPILFEITNKFLEFCGLWIGDGSYDGCNKNVVIISNTDKECRNVFKDIANNLGLNYSKMNDDEVSLRLHSTIFYKFMKKVLGFKGYSKTKKIPEFIFNLSNKQLKHFIKGYYSADGCMLKYEVSCASQSRELLEDLQSIFLRFGIISRINKISPKDGCINMNISGFENISKYKEIGFLQERKNSKLNLINKKAHHTCSDIIPMSLEKIKQLNQISETKLQSNYLKGFQNMGRDYMQRIAPTGSEFNDLSHTEILWDKVIKIEKVSSEEIEVFDLSIPKYEKFLCDNIFVHNTAELNLKHDNWLPSVSRAGVGGEGKAHGEVSLFDLLKESLRQRPDYIIVGEVRGQEAFVLFQAMATGHPSYGTMHADDIKTMVERLKTPPISLSPSLVESLDAACVMIQTKVNGQPVRRLKEISEIVKVGQASSDLVINTPFVRDPATDRFMFKTDSKVLAKIMQKTGMTWPQLLQEFKNRTMLLMALYRQKIFGFAEVQSIIHEYYKKPQEVLKKFGIIK